VNSGKKETEVKSISGKISKFISKTNDQIKKKRLISDMKSIEKKTDFIEMPFEE
jgi:hypothetical protein